MVERARRLRVRPSQPGLRGPRETLPGPTTWVRPATGWWGRMNAGKARGIKGVPYGRPCPFPEGGLGALGKRRSGAPRGERPASLGVRRKAQLPTVASFGAPLPSPLVRGSPLVSEGNGNSGAPRALREQGRRSFDFFRAPAV